MTVPGGYSAGNILTAGDMNLLPGGLEGTNTSVATKTGDQTGISTITDVTSLTVTFTAVANRYYKITLVGMVGNNSATAQMNWYIRNGGGTTLATGSHSPYTTGVIHSFTLVCLNAPGAGSVTYKASAAVASGTFTFYGSATAPALIMVEDAGPT